MRDQRRGEGRGGWIESIEAQLERFRASGVPFAVLLVRASAPEHGPLGHSFAEGGVGELALEQLLAGVASGTSAEPGSGVPGRPGRAGSLTRERAGRYWLILPGLDRAGAQLLGERLTREVSLAASQAGAELEIAVGTASCPRDGHDAGALAAHADVGLHAARAAARSSALSGPGTL